ncbi:hypothetical protein CHISP_0272 [Chitinispirillum alkaliphilum]|nr:hypothetical protein CHISP_0272 [Chitinispirillum alkaliphilum]
MNKRTGANSRKSAAKKKQSRNRVAKKVISAIMLVSCVIAVLYFGWLGGRELYVFSVEALDSSDLLSVKQVEIKNSTPEMERKIDSVIDTLIEEKIYRVKPGKIISALETIPEIRDVKVRRSLRGKVTITINKRTPFVLFQAGEMYLADREGVVYPVKTGVFYEYPVITGSKIENGKIYSRDLEYVLNLIDYAKRMDKVFYRQISQINMSDSNQIYFTFSSSPVKYIVPRIGFESRLAHAEKIQQMITEGLWDPESVNLSSRDLAFLRLN